MTMDCTFKTPEGNFNYRVAAVICREGKILAMREETIGNWYLPGGRVKLHETLERALLREMGEELYLPGKIVRPLWLCENFFVLEEENIPYHELCMYFLVTLPEKGLPEGGEFWLTDTDGVNHQYRWLSKEDLQREQLYPSFLREEWPGLPEHLELRTIWD